MNQIEYFHGLIFLCFLLLYAFFIILSSSRYELSEVEVYFEKEVLRASRFIILGVKLLTIQIIIIYSAKYTTTNFSESFYVYLATSILIVCGILIISLISHFPKLNYMFSEVVDKRIKNDFLKFIHFNLDKKVTIRGFLLFVICGVFFSLTIPNILDVYLRVLDVSTLIIIFILTCSSAKSSLKIFAQISNGILALTVFFVISTYGVILVYPMIFFMISIASSIHDTSLEIRSEI